MLVLHMKNILVLDMLLLTLRHVCVRLEGHAYYKNILINIEKVDTFSAFAGQLYARIYTCSTVPLCLFHCAPLVGHSGTVEGGSLWTHIWTECLQKIQIFLIWKWRWNIILSNDAYKYPASSSVL